MTKGQKVNWDSDDKNMIEANSEIVRLARYFHNPWRKEDGITNTDDMYKLGKQKERWAELAASFLFFTITGDQAKARLEVLLKRAQHLSPAPRARNHDGGSGSDDIQRLSERERNLVALLESSASQQMQW